MSSLGVSFIVPVLNESGRARQMNVRSRLSRVATGDQMLFVHRELFEKTAGFLLS